MNSISNIKDRLNFKTIIRKNIRNLFLLGIIILLFIIFSFMQPVFYEFGSIMNMVRKTGVLFIVSIGMSLIMLTGGLDLSIGSSLALSGACGAIVLNLIGNPFIAMITTIAIASLIGFINGFIIGKFKINAIVLTLAMLGITRSLALVISKSSTINVKSKIFNWLGSYDIKTVIGKLPVSLFFIIIFFIFFYCILNYSVLGKKLIAIGGNVKAAKVAGLSVDRHIILAYLIMGSLVGLGAIMAVGRSFSAAPLAGVGLEFEAISAVIIGGANLGGGKIDLKGTFLGVLLLAVIFNGLTLVNIPSFYIEITKGLILLIAILINHYLEKYQVEY